MSGKLTTLVLKDLYLHRGGILGTWLLMAAPLSMMHLIRPVPDTAVLGFVTLFYVLLNVAYGEWLIDREKSKGTFAWLRSLPVSDFTLVMSKFLALSVMNVVGYVLLMTAFLVNPSQFKLTLAVLLTAVLLAGSLTMASKWILGEKLGRIVPMALLLGAIPVMSIRIRDRERVLELARQWPDAETLQWIALAAGIMMIAAVWLGTLVWFMSRDTNDLID